MQKNHEPSYDLLHTVKLNLLNFQRYQPDQNNNGCLSIYGTYSNLNESRHRTHGRHLKLIGLCCKKTYKKILFIKGSHEIDFTDEVMPGFLFFVPSEVRQS